MTGALLACPLEELLHPVAALTQEVGFDIRRGCGEEAKTALIRERAANLASCPLPEARSRASFAVL